MGLQQEFDIDTARAHVCSGSIKTAVVRSVNTNMWAVYFPVQTGEAMLVTTRDRKPRLFRDAHLALKALREISVISAQVEMKDWSTTAGKVPAWGRADQAELMKRTHARAGAEAKFERTLKAAIDEAPEVQWNKNEAIVKAVTSKVQNVAAATIFAPASERDVPAAIDWDPMADMDFSIDDVVAASLHASPMR